MSFVLHERSVNMDGSTSRLKLWTLECCTRQLDVTIICLPTAEHNIKLIKL